MADQERRTFLKWAIHGMGALFGVVLGCPAIAYLLDARNRPAREAKFRPVDGIRLTGDFPKDTPQQGILRDVRQDAWTLHPSDVIGRVWVVRFSDEKDAQGKYKDFRVFTTVCPHLGCSINSNPPPNQGFTCPCHGGEFKLDGALVHRPERQNPAPRPMDSLNWKRDQDNPEILLVEYQNFKQGVHEKEAKT